MDTVSRQAAIEHWRLIIDATSTDSGYNMGFVDGLEFCISHLSTMPSAQPDTTIHDSNVVKKGGNDEDRTSSDCISRQQAIDKIKKRLFETAFNNVGIKQNIDETLVDVAENRLENWFNELLSIQPERKTGRWLPDNTDYYRTRFICSVCGESEDVPTMGFGYAPMWGYCPNCGADMRGEEHG